MATPELHRTLLPTLSSPASLCASKWVPGPPELFFEANSLASLPPLLLSSLADHCFHLGSHSLPSGSHETLAFLEEGRCRVGGESSCQLLCLRRASLSYSLDLEKAELGWPSQISCTSRQQCILHGPAPSPACQLSPRVKLLLCHLFLDVRTVAS